MCLSVCPSVCLSVCLPVMHLSVRIYLQFPLCDGSHNQHNADNGDNVGPLKLVMGSKEQDKKKKKKEQN